MHSEYTGKAGELPRSCKSAMEQKNRELEREDCGYEYANISESCRAKLTEYEHELESQGLHNIALVAYHMDH